VLSDVTEETIDAMLAQVGPGTQSGLLFTELRHLGGAFSRPAPTGGALSHVTGAYALFAVTIAPGPEAAAAGQAAATAVVRALAPWSQASRVPTFTDLQVETSSMFDGEAWVRLLQLREAADPGRLFVANHQL
jgi:hypothetical protein